MSDDVKAARERYAKAMAEDGECRDMAERLETVGSAVGGIRGGLSLMVARALRRLSQRDVEKARAEAAKTWGRG